MITPKQIADVTMTPEKKAMARNDFFAFYVGRPLSYLLTIPFLYLPLTPNQVSMISIIPLIVGSVVMYIGENTLTFIAGWLCFFLWNLLDGVDGNMARYRKQFSRMGSVWDAMAGYVAMVLQPLSWGIAASHNVGYFQTCIQLPVDLYTVLGALSGVCAIFPRLVMHKTISTLGHTRSTDAVKDKSKFSLIKVVMLNLTSNTGFMQVFMLLSIFVCAFDAFTLSYFMLNGIVMLGALYRIFKNN